MVVEGHDYIGV